MRVILCAELGELVVQMFMGLLCRVSGMHGNNDYSCPKPIYLQAHVRKKSEDEALEYVVQEGQVSWLC